jgi:hypothetical protein
VSDTIIVEPVVYELVVTQEVYELDVTAPGPQGIQGPEGPPGTASGYFVYNQVAPASTWNITHNLGYNPATTTVDSAGNVVEGTLLYLTTNTLRITFGIAISGSAYMS